MAEVSYLQLHLNDDHDHEDGYDDRDEFVNSWSHDLHGFDAYHPELDCPYSHDFFPHSDQNLFDRENQVNFVIDMFHQSVEQSCMITETDLRNPYDWNFHQGNDGTDVNDLEVEFESHVEVNNNGNDSGDDFFVSTRTTGDPSSQSGYPECFMGEFSVPDLGSDNVAGETEMDESNLQLSWDAFPLEDDNDRGDTHPNPNANVNEDFEWEEIDGWIDDDREVLQMIFESEPDDDESDLPGIHPNSYDTSELDEEQPDPLEWEVLLNVQNLEANPPGQFNGNNFTEYDILFGQFADNNASSSGQPPASTTAVENLLSVVITDEDVEKNDTHCAVCKDEIGTGLMAKQLPCSHRYHGDCIVKWLRIHNTCPLCRQELLTDDPDYERKKADRAAQNH